MHNIGEIHAQLSIRAVRRGVKSAVRGFGWRILLLLITLSIWSDSCYSLMRALPMWWRSELVAHAYGMGRLRVRSSAAQRISLAASTLKLEWQ